MTNDSYILYETIILLRIILLLKKAVIFTAFLLLFLPKIMISSNIKTMLTIAPLTKMDKFLLELCAASLPAGLKVICLFFFLSFYVNECLIIPRYIPVEKKKSYLLLTFVT